MLNTKHYLNVQTRKNTNCIERRIKIGLTLHPQHHKSHPFFYFFVCPYKYIWKKYMFIFIYFNCNCWVCMYACAIGKWENRVWRRDGLGAAVWPAPSPPPTPHSGVCASLFFACRRPWSWIIIKLPGGFICTYTHSRAFSARVKTQNIRITCLRLYFMRCINKSTHTLTILKQIRRKKEKITHLHNYYDEFTKCKLKK